MTVLNFYFIESLRNTSVYGGTKTFPQIKCCSFSMLKSNYNLIDSQALCWLFAGIYCHNFSMLLDVKIA